MADKNVGEGKMYLKSLNSKTCLISRWPFCMSHLLWYENIYFRWPSWKMPPTPSGEKFEMSLYLNIIYKCHACNINAQLLHVSTGLYVNFNGSSGRYRDLFNCYLFYWLAYSRSLRNVHTVILYVRNMARPNLTVALMARVRYDGPDLVQRQLHFYDSVSFLPLIGLRNFLAIIICQSNWSRVMAIHHSI